MTIHFHHHQHSSSFEAEVLQELDKIIQHQENSMATIDELKQAQAEEKADLATLAGLVTSILSAVSKGQMSAADAQAILDEMHSQDSTIKTTIASIQAVLPTAPAA